MFKQILVGFVVALTLTGIAAAEPFEDGMAAYERGDYETAIELWRPLAEQGLASAQFSLGIMYAGGKGVVKDLAEAAKWYRRAAKQGDVDAQFRLGFFYRWGSGVRTDYPRAYMWYDLAAAQGHARALRLRDEVALRMTPDQTAEAQHLVHWWKLRQLIGTAAHGPYEDGLAAFERSDAAIALTLWGPLAEQGHPGAQTGLGTIYGRGYKDVLQDHVKAAIWNRRAAEQGLADAQNKLGVAYRNGDGVTQDYLLAHMWFNLAAAQGDEDARENRDGLAGRMTPDQIAEAQRLAREWKPKPER